LSGDTRPLHRRLLWMAGIWCASVLALGIVAMLIRLMLRH
jgi:Protein of unknown function (DUF2474)